MGIQSDSPLPVASRDIAYRSLRDGGVLFSIHDEVYYGLNTVGACLWEALPPVTATVEAMCTHLKVRYPDADPGALRRDVEELLDDLVRYGLVTDGKDQTLQ
jgi:hypothetical protein